MLLTKTLKIKWHYKTKEWYENKGYIFIKYGEEFEVKVEDLQDGSNVFVQVKCDCKDCKNPHLPPTKWQKYKKYVKNDGKYYCHACTNKLFVADKARNTKLENSKSFEQWCIENNHQDVSYRWDYELNGYSPSEICYSANKKYYFKCPRGIHESELKSINNFTNGQEGSIDCNQCNSIAQWIIDNLGNEFYDKRVDHEKHKELGIDLWSISYSSNKIKIWIKCQNPDKQYHGSYPIAPDSFITGNRCPYCTNRCGKVHELDSLGTLYPESLLYWSDKNYKTPYEYAPKSKQEVWWKCPEGEHDDFPRNINNSNIYDFRCPSCSFSKGEKKIEEYLKINNYIENINYIPQKEFDGLLGINNGKLSYDFYLPQYNLLIEYQGEQHEKYIKVFHKSKKDFEKQLEHDNRKREYAQNNKIKLLEIWYYDFDNIGDILNKELFDQW